MYNANNVRTLKKVVREMKKGETLYINAISCSFNMIGQLREYIKDGVLAPDEEEVKKSYNDVESVMNGTVIFPQMTYIKQ